MPKFTCEFSARDYRVLEELRVKKQTTRADILRQALTLYFRIKEEFAVLSPEGHQRRLVILEEGQPPKEIWILGLME